MGKQDFKFFERVGDVRPSQLLYTHGIGMVVDLQNASVMVLGTDDWNYDDTHPIVEDRLLAAVRQELGHQVQELRVPPRALSSETDRAAQRIGVPVAAFPRWLVCPYCRLLAPIASGLFRLSAPAFRPEEVSFVHDNCSKAKKPGALPIRFLVACDQGHLDDFPWVDYVHRGSPCSNPLLEMTDDGATGQVASVFVRCRTCQLVRSMTEAFGDPPSASIENCSGRWPHLRSFDSEPCTSVPKPILLGASNIWFPRVFSTLAIPKAEDELGKLLEQHLDDFADVESEIQLAGFRVAKKQQLRALKNYSDAEIWAVLEARRNALDENEGEATNVKLPEWEAFISPESHIASRDFQLRQVEVPAQYSDKIESVVLAERLREVRAFIGFNRLRSANDFGDISGVVSSERLAPLGSSAPEWVPASDVRGEGIFIRFGESALREWEEQALGSARALEFSEARKKKLMNRELVDQAAHNDPGLMRRTLLHTFSHALMRALSLESGYSLSSLTERIYSTPPTEREGPMAGVLIYTAASDSEGTLGGLVRLGETAHLGRAIDRAMSEMSICASDPLCAEHPPDIDDGRELHGAACHACLFAPETSCEMGNQWLDRTVLVETFCRQGLEFLAR